MSQQHRCFEWERPMARWLILWATMHLGCDGEDEVAQQRCTAVIWANSQSSNVDLAVIGGWDSWSASVAMVSYEEDPWWYAQLELSPGKYEYLIIDHGRARLDPYNPMGGFRSGDGVEVSWLEVDDCTVPRIEAKIGAAKTDLAFSVLPARSGERLAGADLAVYVDGRVAEDARPIRTGDDVRVNLGHGAPGRHHVELRATGQGHVDVVGRAVMWSQPRAEEFRDSIIYQIMIDRFRGNGGTTLAPPNQPGERAGGTLGGVVAELEKGSFDDLGVSMLWLSPVYLNPEDLRMAPDRQRLMSGYHGYWPVDTRVIDPHIGGESALTKLIEAAHTRGVEVMLDVVFNHYDESNARVDSHRDDGWFNRADPLCICGASDCAWAQFAQTCWFAPYLPDVRLQHPDALAAAIADAVWLVERFDVDGLRFDAVPMMPRTGTRRILHALRRAVQPRATLPVLAEVFTGAGVGATASIRYHLGPHGFDSAFDFPGMWAIREALGGGRGFDHVVQELMQQELAYEGSGVVMARILGNHDTSRFASALSGDDGGDPWTNPAPPRDDPELLAKLRLGFTMLLTLPGVPVIYYGDEYGLPGGSDPDNRRVLPEAQSVGPFGSSLREYVASLGRLRRELTTLRRGSWDVVAVTPDELVVIREFTASPTVLLMFSRQDRTSTVGVAAGIPAGWYKDAVSGERVEVMGDGRLDLELAAWDARVLIREDSGRHDS